MMKKLLIPLGLLFLCSSCSWLTLTKAVAAIPVTNAYINFAGAGGDFTTRTATFRVPDATTITNIGNGLRLYEAHLAKMIEVTESFCKDREPSYIIYWNYEADNGRIFMGQFNLSCRFARDTFKKFGASATEKVTIHHRGEPTQETIKVLNLQGTKAKQFITLVRSLKPNCVETVPKICPGDRLE